MPPADTSNGRYAPTNSPPAVVGACRSNVADRLVVASLNGWVGSAIAVASVSRPASSMPCEAASCSPARSGSASATAPINGAKAASRR